MRVVTGRVLVPSWVVRPSRLDHTVECVVRLRVGAEGGSVEVAHTRCTTHCEVRRARYPSVLVMWCVTGRGVR